MSYQIKEIYLKKLIFDNRTDIEINYSQFLECFSKIVVDCTTIKT